MTLQTHVSLASRSPAPLPDPVQAEREAARLLVRILEQVTIEHVGRHKAVLSFEASLGLLERLCLWGADLEDVEDDAPLEADAV